MFPSSLRVASTNASARGINFSSAPSFGISSAITTIKLIINLLLLFLKIYYKYIKNLLFYSISYKNS